MGLVAWNRPKVLLASCRQVLVYIRWFSRASDAPNHFCGIVAEHVPFFLTRQCMGSTLEPTRAFAGLVQAKTSMPFPVCHHPDFGAQDVTV